MAMIDTLMAELKKVIPACAQDIYKGSAAEYVVVAVTETGICYGDDDAQLTSLLISVSWCYAWEPHIKSHADWRAKKQQLRDAIIRAGCTSPTVTEAGDYEWGRLVYECRAIEHEVE